MKNVWIILMTTFLLASCGGESKEDCCKDGKCTTENCDKPCCKGEEKKCEKDCKKACCKKDEEHAHDHEHTHGTDSTHTHSHGDEHDGHKHDAEPIHKDASH